MIIAFPFGLIEAPCKEFKKSSQNGIYSFFSSAFCMKRHSNGKHKQDKYRCINLIESQLRRGNSREIELESLIFAIQSKFKKYIIQAGAELCQAQGKHELDWF